MTKRLHAPCERSNVPAVRGGSGDENLVQRRDDAGTTFLTLNRPEKLNALNYEMFAELRHHVIALGTEESVDCVVLQGAGRSFCAGHDLESIRFDHEDLLEAETIDLIELLPCPTIAKLHGHCFTGGLELALACDLLVAATDAKLGDTHGQWDLVPAWGMSVRLPERVGQSTAKSLMFTSRRIDGAEAARIGLVDRAVAPDTLDTAIKDLAAEISANCAGSNRIVKRLLADGSRLSRLEALANERSLPYGVPAAKAQA
jgi:enoyl-CoA hydratase